MGRGGSGVEVIRVEGSGQGIKVHSKKSWSLTSDCSGGINRNRDLKKWGEKEGEKCEGFQGVLQHRLGAVVVRLQSESVRGGLGKLEEGK